MRIIAGRYKGRTLLPVPGSSTRPTTSRVREAWASSLLTLCGADTFEGLRVLDPFAGSGALGFELLSRGAASCVFCDTEPRALKVLRSTAAALELSEAQARVCHCDSFSPALLGCLKGQRPFSLVVLDPPYAATPQKIMNVLALLGRAGFITNKSIVSYEHAAELEPELDGFVLCKACSPMALHLVQRKIYGTIGLDYYRCQ